MAQQSVLFMEQSIKSDSSGQMESGVASLSSPKSNSSPTSRPKALSIAAQRKDLGTLELHTLDTVWHHLIPWTHKHITSDLCKCINICKKKEIKPTSVDGFIHFIYNKWHLFSLTLSTLLYIVWILSRAYEINQCLTSLVYWWFIIEATLLLYTANFRMYKDLLFTFNYWFKIVSIIVGVIARQLVFDGPDRFLASGWHFFSGVSAIISYFIASAIVAGLTSYNWSSTYFIFGRQYNWSFFSVIVLIFTIILNTVQIWQIYHSNMEFTIAFLGKTVSCRNSAMSAYSNATLFYLKQLYMDTCYRHRVPQMVSLDWKVDKTSDDWTKWQKNTMEEPIKYSI